MRSIQRRFNKIAEKHPLWGSIICFAETVRNQKFSRQMIHIWFNRLVKNGDYDRKEKRAVLAHLDNL